MVTHELVTNPIGTEYRLALAPPLWFWASSRSIDPTNAPAFIAARQILLEVDVLNTFGDPVARAS